MDYLKDGVFLTDISSFIHELRLFLIEELVIKEEKVITLTSNPNYKEQDSYIETIITELLTRYFEALKEDPIPSRDVGYVAGLSNPEFRADANPIAAFIERIIRSTDALAVLIFLDPSSSYLHFPHQKFKLSIKTGSALVFPANWYFKPNVVWGKQYNQLYTLSTFVDFPVL